MNHKGTVTIETERLILRRFYLKDAKFMFYNWANDREVTKYLSWQPHKNVKDSRRRICLLKRSYMRKNYYDWAIVLKETDEPIGSISVVDIDERSQKVHIGYCIGKKYWRKGITSEALSVLMDFFFDEVGANRIEAMHDKENVNSGKVMTKCGMKYEGTLREYFINNTGIKDMCFYGIVKGDR